jgi:hypothetical protein
MRGESSRERTPKWTYLASLCTLSASELISDLSLPQELTSSLELQSLNAAHASGGSETVCCSLSLKRKISPRNRPPGL